MKFQTLKAYNTLHIVFVILIELDIEAFPRKIAFFSVKRHHYVTQVCSSGVIDFDGDEILDRLTTDVIRETIAL